jgi:hypothetical protein
VSSVAKVAACFVLSAGLALLLVLSLRDQHSSTDAVAFVLVPIYIACLLAIIVFGDVVACSACRAWKTWREIARDDRRA